MRAKLPVVALASLVLSCCAVAARAEAPRTTHAECSRPAQGPGGQRSPQVPPTRTPPVLRRRRATFLPAVQVAAPLPRSRAGNGSLEASQDVPGLPGHARRAEGFRQAFASVTPQAQAELVVRE